MLPKELIDLQFTMHPKLNNRSCVISGASLPHALVRSLDGKYSAEYSWQTVENILLNKQGQFTT